MPTIDKLTALNALTSADQLPVYSAQQGDARKASLALLLEWLQENLVSTDDKRTQYSAPTTNFTLAVRNDGNSTWLLLTPTGTIAAGTLTLPASDIALDKQEVLVNSTQIVTTLTVAGNGASVVGAPTTLAAGGFFRLRFDKVNTTWYRVG